MAAAGVAALNARVHLILVSDDPTFHYDERTHHGQPLRWAGARRACPQGPAAGWSGTIID